MLQADVQEGDIRLEDVRAATARSAELLQSYRLRYTISKTFLLDPVLDMGGGVDVARKSTPQVVGLRARDADEMQKGKSYRFAYMFSQGRFAYEYEADDLARNASWQERHAFDGALHHNLTSRSGAAYQEGVLRASIYPTAGLSDEILTPEDFSARLAGRPLDEWYGESNARMTGREEAGGMSCYVVESEGATGQERGKLWLAPEAGFRAMRMEWQRKDGTRRVYTVTRIEEVAPEVWFPMEAVQENYIKDPQSGEAVLFSKFVYKVEGAVEANVPIDDAAFTFEFPAGTRVTLMPGMKTFVAGGDTPATTVNAILSALKVAATDDVLHVVREDTGGDAGEHSDTAAASVNPGGSDRGAPAGRLYLYIAAALAVVVVTFIVAAARRGRRKP